MLLKGSDSNDWQNQGELFGGGYHTAFSSNTSKKNKFVMYENRTDIPNHDLLATFGPNIPAPGPRLLFDTTTGLIYGFTEAGDYVMINNSDSMQGMSNNLTKVKG